MPHGSARRIDKVEARGKHLLIHFERRAGAAHPPAHDGVVARVPGARAVAEAGLPRSRVVVGADSGWVGVCFQAPVVETFHERAGAPPSLAGLGPDLCRPESLADDVLDDVLERAARLTPPDATLGEALLDQRIAAGIGNVYKSEACFAVGVDPGSPFARGQRRGPPAGVERGGSPAAGQPRLGPSAGPIRPVSPSTAAAASRAAAAAPRSGSPVTASRRGARTGARPASPPSELREGFHKRSVG